MKDITAIADLLGISKSRLMDIIDKNEVYERFLGELATARTVNQVRKLYDGTAEGSKEQEAAILKIYKLY